MEKAGTRARDIQFYSEKNQKMVCVHSRQARDYANFLENQCWVSSYETCKILEQNQFMHVNHTGFRKEVFQINWVSDFYIVNADGRISIRELATMESLKKYAMVQRLELSRRYWSLFDVDWNVLLIEDAKGGCI